MSNLHKDIGVPNPVAERAPDVVTCPSCRSRWRWAAPDGAGRQVRCSRCSEVFAIAASPRAYRLRAVDVATAPGATPATAPAVAATARAVHVTARIGGASGGLRIGMDDPSLAAKVARSSLSERGEHGPRAWSWTVVADETVSAASPAPASAGTDPVEDPAPGPASLREAPLTGKESVVPSEDVASPAAAAVDSAPDAEAPVEDIGVEWAFEDPTSETEAADGASEVPDEDAAGPATGRARRRPMAAVAGFVVVFGLAAAGATAGWWAAGPLAATMARWTEMWPPIADWVVPTDPMFWTAPGAATGLLVAWMWVRWMQRKR